MNENGVPHDGQKPSARPGLAVAAAPDRLAAVAQKRLDSATLGLAMTAATGS